MGLWGENWGDDGDIGEVGAAVVGVVENVDVSGLEGVAVCFD